MKKFQFQKKCKLLQYIPRLRLRDKILSGLVKPGSINSVHRIYDINRIINKKGLIFFFIFVFAVAKIYIAIQSSSMGSILSKLEKDENDYIKQNREKQSNLIILTSLLSLENKAQEFGYLENPQKLYIKIDQSSVSILK